MAGNGQVSQAAKLVNLDHIQRINETEALMLSGFCRVFKQVKALVHFITALRILHDIH